LKGSTPNLKDKPPTDAMDEPPFYKIFTIPTVVNGVVQKALTTKSGPPLGQKKFSHKVVLFSDSHLKGIAAIL
jgi:hypothetical protein